MANKTLPRAAPHMTACSSEIPATSRTDRPDRVPRPVISEEPPRTERTTVHVARWRRKREPGVRRNAGQNDNGRPRRPGAGLAIWQRRRTQGA